MATNKQLLYETEARMIATTESLIKQTENINQIDNDIDTLNTVISKANIMMKKMYSWFSFPKKLLNTNSSSKSIQSATHSFDKNMEKPDDEITNALQNIKVQLSIQKKLIAHSNESIDQIIKKTNISTENLARLNYNMKKEFCS